MNRHFSKEDIFAANKHMKKSSSSLVIREMQIKTILRYHLMPVRMVIIKKFGDNRHWKDVEKYEHFYTAGGSINQFNHCGRQSGDSSRIQKQKFHLTQQSHYWVFTQRIIKSSIIKTCLLGHCLQQQRHGTNPKVHQRLDKANVAKAFVKGITVPHYICVGPDNLQLLSQSDQGLRYIT